MKYYARVSLTKEFRVEFPEELFTEDNLKWIREYCTAFSDLSIDSIQHEIITAWAINGDGYYEQFGCSIGMFPTREGFPHVRVWDEDTEIDGSYLEED